MCSWQSCSIIIEAVKDEIHLVHYILAIVVEKILVVLLSFYPSLAMKLPVELSSGLGHNFAPSTSLLNQPLQIHQLVRLRHEAIHPNSRGPRDGFFGNICGYS